MVWVGRRGKREDGKGMGGGGVWVGNGSGKVEE
jgi:hypothetical protein